MGGGNVTLVGRPEVACALKGISTTLDVLLTVQTDKNDESFQRPPLNLALVLDKSGSMSTHNKIEFSKIAIKEIIDSLSERDVLHLVTYESEVEVIFENAIIGFNREDIKASVESISTAGGTNLHEGLMRANEIIKMHDFAGYTKRIFLFSDGLANEGVTSHREVNKLVQEVYDSGIRVDSFGIGENFDSAMMKNIAEYGGGQFIYVQSGDDIPKLVGRVLQGLMKVIGTNAVLKVRGLNCAVVKQLYGYNNLLDGCKIGDLRDDNQRHVLYQVEVSPSSTEKSDCPILSYTLSYTTLKSVDNLQAEHVELSGIVSMKLTHDEELVKMQEKDKAVGMRSVMHKSAVNDKEVEKLVQSNNFNEAISLQEKTHSLLTEAKSLDPIMISRLLKMSSLALEKLKQRMSKESEKILSHCHYLKCNDSDLGFGLFD